MVPHKVYYHFLFLILPSSAIAFSSPLTLLSLADEESHDYGSAVQEVSMPRTDILNTVLLNSYKYCLLMGFIFKKWKGRLLSGYTTHQSLLEK